MGRPVTPKRGYRTMNQDRIFKLNMEGCQRGINSCRTALSNAKKYGDHVVVETMEIQIGAFLIQMDMIKSGDIVL